ncbi:NAD-binding protein [Ensifer sp. ENS07]|uniref:NAD(P)-dependent oxidoreductase n=1 Tax=Ensifer sp. ENS07 TaxID=2769274 RepID=UPI00177E4CC8|nr:NAD-binding protein [Ensifer sp. ENS07]
MKIGYLGLGAMGGALAAHLAKAFDLAVYDRNPLAVEALVGLGAKAAVSPADLARSSDVILLCLPRSTDVEDALFAPGGLSEGLAPGKLVIDQTSGIPGITGGIAQKLEASGVAMLDAPLSGGIPAAKNGTVTIIASGPDDAWTRGEPVLRAMTQKVFRCSDRVGDGQALKLVNNAIGAGYRIATLELTALARKTGLSLGRIVETLNTGPAANFTSRNMLAGLVEGRSSTNFALSLMIKDLNEAFILGLETNAAMPMTAGARSVMQVGLNLLGPDARLDDVIPLTEQLSGVALRDETPAHPALSADSIDEAGLLRALERATIVCNAIAICECVAVGRNYGLTMDEMARILTVGSAWSETMDAILPALASCRAPILGFTLGEACSALAQVTRLSAAAYMPAFLPNAALVRAQVALATADETSDAGALSTTFGLAG